MTPLFNAAQRGHLSVVKLLLDRGAAMNHTLANGFTPFSIAARQGHFSVV
jgi:ankyrin repeat protein